MRVCIAEEAECGKGDSGGSGEQYVGMVISRGMTIV